MTPALMSAAEAVCEAIREHAAAIEGASEARPAAGLALVAALDAYGEAVLDAGEELPDEFNEFDEWLGEEDGVEHPDDEVEPDRRVAVFVRADFAVEDFDELRAAGLRQWAECCGPAAGGSVQADIRTAADALGHLVGHAKSVFADDLPGLRLLSEAVVTIGGASEALHTSPWDPLLLLPEAPG